MSSSTSSTDAGTSPPRRRRRHDTSSSAEERPRGPETAGEEEAGGGGHEAVAPPVGSNRGRQSKARGSRGARGGRVRGSRRSTRTDEEEFGSCIIDNELLIQMVEDRPPLWDHTDRRHADHHGTRLLWLEICEVLVPNWDDLNESQREECRTTILVRWRSMRDRYKKDYNEEVKRPSGSGGSQKRPYRYAAALGFLRRTLQLRSTSSSTRAQQAPREVLPESGAQEAVPEEPPTAGPSRPTPTAGRDLNVPLPVPSGDATMATMAPLFEALMRRQRTGRSRQADYEDLTRLVYESLMGYTNRIAALEEQVRRLQEGAVHTSQLGPVHHYWYSLLPVMERFTPDQLFEARRQVDSVLWQMLLDAPNSDAFYAVCLEDVFSSAKPELEPGIQN
ncbi:uncharacterized protein LOC122935341 [Bufo gargarizans]|uniref:uncharacterized protein LOC122928858 n=2 Tax=Bufo gargarizans TaxID=30331 RepID=UPI001CF52009|nr:uncharacterized protein LOC122928858 [Bufo gargarizans]XP_044147042.1 uncharacterized protein LOC122935341 [Bufo gargarizans]